VKTGERSKMLVCKLKEAIKKVLIKYHAALVPLIPNKHLPYRFAGGRIYLNIKESPMMLARILGQYEVAKTKAISILLGSGATLVDVGANKGDFTLLAARAVGKDGRVLSFEPEPENCKWIRKSMQLNGYTNIALYEVALSGVDGSAQLHLGKKSGWHTLLPVQSNLRERTINVPTRALDSVLEEANQFKVDVMKVDVEGAELEVLKGAYSTLSNNRNIVLLVDIHPALGVDPEEVCSFLLKLGFSIYEMSFPFNTPARIDNNLKEILARR
jgi:FkbM family methyltransferase